MEVIAAVTGKIAELTVVPIGRQAGHLLFYKKRFKELEDIREELGTTKVRIEHDVEAEKRNGREIEDEVLNWQKRVDETLENVNKLCRDKTHDSVRCWKWTFPNLKSRHQLGRKAKKMAFIVADLKEKGKFDGGVGYVPVSGLSNLILANQSNEKLESRNSLKKEVILALTDPKLSKVGIYGWGGVGKTTLAKEVAKHLKDVGVFDVVAMATISQTLDVKRVQDEIAYQLGFLLDEVSSIGRADRLCGRIKMENNILIILDDLWDKIDLDKLGIPSEQHLKGCKLLLTSRHLGILQMNDTQMSFALQTLNIAESKSLFEDMVGDAIKDANLQEIATQVVERCVGLPVMIVSIAKSLKYNNNIYYWKDALNNLKSVDNEDMYGAVFSAFEFTYERLKKDEMKKVFLLCGVLGPYLFFNDLLKYVVGLDILKHVDTVEDARNRLYKIIDNLKASCFLLEDDASKTNVIKMHDIVCEIAVSIAQRNEHVFVMRNDGMQDWSYLERCTQVIILEGCYIQELPQKLDCPNLKFFILDSTSNRTLKIPYSFFEGMGGLEALDLTGFKISPLPRSLVYLTKLKTLCLYCCNLEHMSGIGVLINLEILGFIHSSMKELPREIGQLTHLRMLDLSNSGIESTPPNTLSKLTKLEELYMGKASIKWKEESSTMKNKCASLAELGCLTSLTTLEIQIREAWMLPRDMMFEKLERYKVVIGDKWEWSCNERTSRLLKLKLNTSLHSEHGIRALIKRVEDLYLDEVNGISNVLFDLNGEGFPLLRNLHIQNNGQVQHIVCTTERNNKTHVLFPKLETLTLHNLSSLVNICHGPLPGNSFCKLTIIKVKSCDQLVYLFSVLMVKVLSQLVEIQVSECSSMKRIVLLENEHSDISTDDKIEFYSLHSLSLCHVPLIQDFYSNTFTSLRTNVPTPFFNGIKVSFSSLETLKLSSINLEKIWDDDHLSAANCVHNLTNLIVEDLRGLKHLFSPSLIGSFLKLKHLEISKCEMMEEIIATEVRTNTASQDQVRFSKLENMVIKDMKSLKKVWNFEFDGLKSLEVSNCGKLVNIFPSDTQGTFGSLETLEVRDCGSVEEIFQFDSTKEEVIHLRKISLSNLPKLQYIWKQSCQEIASFGDSVSFHAEVQRHQPLFSAGKVLCPNLEVVWVSGCENLEYLFPYYIAKHAIQLEDISIKNARSIKHVVSDKEGLMDNPVKFEFNHLISLVLWNLDELKGFSAGNQSLQCPLLRKLDIRNCAKLKLFKTQHWSRQGGVFYSKSQVSMQQPLLTLEEVICNLEHFALNSENSNMILQGKLFVENFSKLKFLCLRDFTEDQTTFPYWFLQNITSLEQIVVESSSFKEIFTEELPRDERKTRIKKLSLHQLYELEHVCKEGFPVDPVLEILEFLWVGHCSNLKQLVPSSVNFSDLTYLDVECCHGLLHLITSSTARSLVKLTTMKIRNCNSLKQVVAEEREESEDEIEFNSLKILELECLPNIKRFCSSNCVLNLPSLVKVVLKQCPRMSIFSVKDTSTPMLQEILSPDYDGKTYWEGDLNKTINQMFVDMVAFNNFNRLEFFEYPELKELWYGQVGQKIFSNLKHLVVRKCTFLSNVLFSSNLLQLLYTLEELEVAECDSLEAIFDVRALDDKTMELKQVSQLKNLTISGPPNLKHIWNREAGEIMSFGNLQTLHIDKCQHLKSLFTVSLCQDLKQFKELRIESCGVEEIGSIEEGLKEVKFEFPALTSLKLFNLTQLTNFYPKRCTLHCPSLKILNVRGCEELQIFTFDYLNSQPLRELQTKQALFNIEEVSQNLEELPLNEEDTMRILNGNYEKNLFQNIITLRLQYFRETPIKLLNDLIQKFPATTFLQARCSSFEILFPSKEIGHCRIERPTQIKTLWLYQLEQLEHIWSDDDSASHPLVSNLADLAIRECCSLIRLAPPLASFTNLTTLEVEDCNGLMYFMSTFTAKSLVHLKSLEVRNCEMLEEVVMIDEGGSEEEIIFKSLKYLELGCLSRFKSFCCGKHTFIFSSLVTLKVIRCLKMQNFSTGVIIAPFLKLVEVENEKKHWKGDLNTTINHLFIEKTKNLNTGTSEVSSSKEHVGESKPNQITDTGKKEIHNLPSESYDTQQNEQTSSSGIERTLGQVTQNASSPSTNQDTAKENETMGENIARPMVEDVKETIEKPLSQIAQEAHSSAAIQDIEGSHESETCPNKNLFNLPQTFATSDKKETIGTQEIHDTIDKPLIQTDQDAANLATKQITGTQQLPSQLDGKEHNEQASSGNERRPQAQATQNASNPSTNQDTAIGTQEIHDTIDKPLIQTDQDAAKLATTQIPDEPRDLHIETQKICDTIHEPPIPAAQNVPNSNMIREAAIGPSPSQVLEPMVSSMVDIPEQNMPYLEAGVKRHPQVLDWLHTKRRRRVFASSFFSLFADVTRILRTTRKVDLTADDRNYIRECCSALQGIGFDDSWISYVHDCIEECGDGEDLKRKVEEAEGQASNLKDKIECMKVELASVEESLVLLRDKASKLHDFIES